MTNRRMCGVVLWSSEEEGRAVIWCEDHGNLAFYSHGTDAHFGPSLDPGDLIDFDLDDTETHRMAYNPRLLVEDHSPTIAAGLRHGAGALRAAKDTTPERSNVVTLRPRLDERMAVA